MTGIEGVRVIIVDDKDEEALPVLKALSTRGIPAAYFQHSVAPRFPEPPLIGVRLAALDMRLVEQVADPRASAATLVGFLRRILSPQNGPYIALAWTKYPDDVRAFEERIFGEGEVPKPILTVPMDKNECLAGNGFDLPRVVARLAEALATSSPLLLATAWEEQVFKAATGVTNALSGLVTPNGGSLQAWRDDWRTQLLQLMHTMAKAEAGAHLDAETCLRALYSALNPLHADRMEVNVIPLYESLRANAGEIVLAEGGSTLQARARINTMLHLSLEPPTSLFAGNLYRPAEAGPTAASLPLMATLLGELLKREGDQTQRRDTLSAESRIVFVEASPVCDHAQRRVHRARLVAGMLVPTNRRQWVKYDAEFIWEFGPVALDPPVALTGEYYFCFNARQLVTLSTDEIGRMEALGRFRTQPLTALQAWLAHHAARPGILMLSE